MSKNRTFIHIGCHKAGSTFVQEELLQKLKNIKPITFFNKNEYLEKEFLYISQCADIYYENNVEQVISKYYKQFEDIFISAEGLSGNGYNVFTGGFLIESIAKRLHNIFPEGKIIIIIRNQKDAIESYFKDDVKYGYLGDFQSWFNWRLNTYQLNYFKYFQLIKTYQNIFGTDTTGIDKVDFKKSYNKTYSPLSLKITPIINRFFGSKLTHGVTFGKDNRLKMYNLWRYRLSNYFNKIPIYKNQFIFDDYEKILNDNFHENNKKLSNIIDINLNEYGYI